MMTSVNWTSCLPPSQRSVPIQRTQMTLISTHCRRRGSATPTSCPLTVPGVPPVSSLTPRSARSVTASTRSSTRLQQTWTNIGSADQQNAPLRRTGATSSLGSAPRQTADLTCWPRAWFGGCLLLDNYMGTGSTAWMMLLRPKSA